MKSLSGFQEELYTYCGKSLAAGLDASAPAADHDFDVLLDALLYALEDIYTQLLIYFTTTIRDYDLFFV